MRPFLLTAGWGESDPFFGGSLIHSEHRGCDLVAQLAIPMAFIEKSALDLEEAAWLFACVVRLASSPRVRAPIISTAPLDGRYHGPGGRSIPLEREAIPTRLDLAPSSKASLDETCLEWMRAHWVDCLDLLRRDSVFSLLLRAVDGAAFVGDPALALVLLWGALENMFSPSRVELKFRVSGNISCFLEPPGSGRVDVQRAAAKLYDARSAAAHGKPHDALQPAQHTFALARRVLLRILEAGEVPRAAELEEALLAGR